MTELEANVLRALALDDGLRGRAEVTWPTHDHPNRWRFIEVRQERWFGWELCFGWSRSLDRWARRPEFDGLPLAVEHFWRRRSLERRVLEIARAYNTEALIEREPPPAALLRLGRDNDEAAGAARRET